MTELVWIIPALPLAGFLTLAFFGRRLARPAVAWIGAGSVGLSAAAASVLAAAFMVNPPAGSSYTLTLWTWMSVGGFAPQISFYLDPLSIVFVLIITFVGFLIHLYSVEFMADDEGYSRFFAYMNLFIGSMLILVLAGDLLLLYLGWEGVGLCSYLLIGFWYRDPKNGLAARKAFIMTRVGDTAMAIGLFLLLKSFGTLNVQDLMAAASGQWSRGSALAAVSAALLLGGALGKSAQLPLQTWLPDAMAGPTPVSALIHAATMVTAGVYLIGRTHALFELAPVVMNAVAVIGAATLLVAGLSALAQTDIKRVLAYSTISQIGYMFLALGVGAWSAAIFHFVTHAFFKALLFLGAGAVILALDDEHDMTKMGGLRKKLPLVFWSFMAGAASLSALPLVSAGFYSKEMILWRSFVGWSGNPLLWAAGLAGAFITALYTFRMVFITFFGQPKSDVHRVPGWRMNLPLLVLACLSVAGGFVETPDTLGNVRIFSGFLRSVFQALPVRESLAGLELSLQIPAALAPLLGLLAAYLFYMTIPANGRRFSPAARGSRLRRFFFSGWGFDWLYDKLFVLPFIFAARKNRNDVADMVNRGIAAISLSANRGLSWTQSGMLRWYAIGIAAGAIIMIGLAVVL
ncbi:MAG: NADH-quinone oxidoreductase subunit L [Spirochaetes bacterium RBG_16_49_21]|nr:MAG: NADH-quinone oxidoreductase subunit L [Spirochaetes bacterium RBG_16_49_21]